MVGINFDLTRAGLQPATIRIRNKRSITKHAKGVQVDFIISYKTSDQ